MLPLIEGLAARGLPVTVFTDRRFAEAVNRSGATFRDLFASISLEAADDRSLPVPCRYVTFAERHLDNFIAQITEMKTRLVVYDTFAVIAPLASRELGLPHVNLCSGHNVEPNRFGEMLKVDSRVDLADSCLEAVTNLQRRFPDLEISPFCFVSLLSPDLNLYCEPGAFLPARERKPFEPLAFFGSLPAESALTRPTKARILEKTGSRILHIYASFGTVIWRYYRRDALRALGTLAKAFERQPEIRLLISTGGDTLAVRELAMDGVEVESYVDQPTVLDEVDLFVTHHGLNSTHEAIVRQVPMISYPCFWDQPALAQRCQELDLAVPLGREMRQPITESDVLEALDLARARGRELRAGLAKAARWEVEVITARHRVFDRIEALL